jgi:hypothetical protein
MKVLRGNSQWENIVERAAKAPLISNINDKSITCKK